MGCQMEVQTFFKQFSSKALKGVGIGQFQIKMEVAQAKIRTCPIGQMPKKAHLTIVTETWLCK